LTKDISKYNVDYYYFKGLSHAFFNHKYRSPWFQVSYLILIFGIIVREKAVVESINELQRFKLRLLNDYDFTKGDASEQIAVFGNP
jgi:hypothetical protein